MFKNMSLAKKLVLGFSVVLVLLVTTGLIAYNAISNASTDFASYRQMARNTNLSGRIQANLLETRLAALNFIRTGSEESRQLTNERYAKTDGFMEEAKEAITDPERAQLVAKADEALQGYNQGFQLIVKARDERNNQVDNVLNHHGPLMEKGLTEILTSARRDKDMIAAYNASLAMRNLLLARLYATKFLEDNSRDYVERTQKELGACLDVLNTLNEELKNPEHRRILADVMEGHKAYAKGFAEVTDVIFKRNNEVEKIVALGAEIGHDMEEVKLSYMKEQDALGPKVQAANDKAIVIISILSLVAVLLGIFVATVIIRGILRQLGCDPSVIEDVTKKIAGGDLTLKMDLAVKNDASVYASMKNMTEKLKEVVANVKSAADNVATGSQELSASSEEMSQGST